MDGEERRKKIVQALHEKKDPISGGKFAEAFGVSRQVVVQDIALLRASGKNIFSTSRGYVLQEKDSATRVFKVIHSDDEVREELSAIVDLGGIIEDVFVYHRVYGVIRGPLNIRSRLDIEKYLQNIASGKSKLLKNTTSGYHYHTVTAASEEILDLIQEKLQERGFLAKLQDYEPVDFWKKEV
uniref:transcription repressor NadR n=1 Tax=Eubacterium cellulosolvens TaxID=29322 RepID=UPI0004862E86|nr:transcription repressor NadR [[Eubacterium] cellulosolvens]